MQFKSCMIDLETLGKKPGCVILSLGAVMFDPKTKALGPEFYEVISTKSCTKAGLIEDPSTVAWWDKQDIEARTVIAQAQSAKTSKPIATVLKDFKEWMKTHSVEKGGRWVWGNGASFDAPILEAAYDACSLITPWEFWGTMCYRSLKNLHPEIKHEFGGTKHNALADAKHQALHLMDILNPESEGKNNEGHGA